MILLNVLIERKANALNRPFTYRYSINKNIIPGVRVLIPFNHKQIIGYVIEVKEVNINKEEYEKESGFVLNDVIRVIDDSPLLSKELMNLAKDISSFYLAPLISVLQAMLPPSLKPNSSSLKAPKIHYEKYLVIDQFKENDLTPKQIELLRLIYKNKKILKKDVHSPSIIKKLIELKRIREISIETARYHLPLIKKEEPKQLTKDQIEAINKIINSKNKIHLLEGVTGSGKTEIYLKLSEYMLKNNKTVLMLVPEIALTSKIVKDYLSRFLDKIAILHSDLTPSQKYDEYRRIANNKVKIVIGTRSAIFAPLNNIGLIILDEEHVESYKQDNLPFYHAREVAIMRLKYHEAKLVLGSATPLLETRTKALKGLYNYVLLNKRINNFKSPTTYIVDMLRGNNLCYQSHMFSKLLYNKIKDRLEKKEQIILLINRRGYSTSVRCRECGHIYACPNCNIPLTYHKDDNLLKCHHCGHVELVSSTCPNCGSKYIARLGFGTEKIEQEIHHLFPNARTLRLDTDISKVRNNTSKILESFLNLEADILIGTQMVAKGHDFPNVTLVGIVLADIGLSLPSFRNNERVFNLITQAIGRSGRANKEGEAIIQTYNPNHYAITYSSKQDYNSFYLKEMNVRKLSQYPPYTNLISIKIRSNNEENCSDIAIKIINDLNNQKIVGATILGPTTPYIPYLDNYYIKEILIKYKRDSSIKDYLAKIATNFTSKSGVLISIDVDPYDF